MRGTFHGYQLVLCVLLIGGALLGVAEKSESAIMQFSPINTSVGTGDTFAVGVGVDGVIDLYAYQLGIAFDPTILQAVSVTEGNFLPSAGTTFFVPGFIDNAVGQITFNAGTLIGAPPGASGGGRLLTIQFLALAAGTSPLALLIDANNGDGLFDSNLSAIVPTLADGSVTVTDTNTATVPEPASLVLLGIGLSGLSLLRSRSRTTSSR